MSALVVALWLLLLVFPMRRQQDALLEQRGKIRQLLERATDLEQQLIDYRAEISHWRKLVSTCDQKGDNEYDLASFLQWADHEATAAHLTIRDFRPLGQQSFGDYQGTQIELNGFGTYPAVCDFLDRLRRCPSMHRVTHLEISPRSTSRQELALALRVLLISRSTSSDTPQT